MNRLFPNDWQSIVTRKNIELGCLCLIVISTLSVFTTRLTTQETLSLDNGAIQYTGPALNHKMQGTGKLTFQNGDVYEGEFKDGIFHGQGRFTSSQGWTYVGGFHKGMAEGKGTLTTKDKKVYEGQFKQGIYQHEN